MKILIFAAVILVLFAILMIVIRKFFNEDARAQRELNRYLRRPLASDEIGLLYERYIGYLYELTGHVVHYNGALNGYFDRGRDLIVHSSERSSFRQNVGRNQSRFQSPIFSSFMGQQFITVEQKNSLVAR